MVAVTPIVLRLTLMSAVILFVLKSPCPCGTLPSQADASCCTSQRTTDKGNQEPVCGGCCSSTQNSGSPHDGSKLCCASCSIDCKQADASSWNLGAQFSKQDLIVAAMSQPLTVATLQIYSADVVSIYERVLPAAHRSINISTHLLRI